MRAFQLADEMQGTSGATEQFTAPIGFLKNSITADPFRYIDNSIAEEASEGILNRHAALLTKLAS